MNEAVQKEAGGMEGPVMVIGMSKLETYGNGGYGNTSVNAYLFSTFL